MHMHVCVLAYVPMCNNNKVKEAMILRKSWGNIGEDKNEVNIVSCIYEILKKIRIHGTLIMRLIFLSHV